MLCDAKKKSASAQGNKNERSIIRKSSPSIPKLYNNASHKNPKFFENSRFSGKITIFSLSCRKILQDASEAMHGHFEEF